MSILTKEQAEWNRSEIERVTAAMAAAGYPRRFLWSLDDYTTTLPERFEVEGVGGCKVRRNQWYGTEALVPESCGVFRNDYAFVTEAQWEAIQTGKKRIPFAELSQS